MVTTAESPLWRLRYLIRLELARRVPPPSNAALAPESRLTEDIALARVWFAPTGRAVER
jgi:hypothetical protein